MRLSHDVSVRHGDISNLTQAAIHFDAPESRNRGRTANDALDAVGVHEVESGLDLCVHLILVCFALAGAVVGWIALATLIRYGPEYVESRSFCEKFA